MMFAADVFFWLYLPASWDLERTSELESRSGDIAVVVDMIPDRCQ